MLRGVGGGINIMYVPALRLPPVGLLVEKAKEDPPVPTPPNPGPPPKPVGESDTDVSWGDAHRPHQARANTSVPFHVKSEVFAYILDGTLKL